MRKTPDECYRPSARGYPEKLPLIEYDSAYEVRKVRPSGEITWHARSLYLSQVLAGEPIGLKQIDETHWEIYFSFYLLGIFDQRKDKILPCTQWHGKKH